MGDYTKTQFEDYLQHRLGGNTAVESPVNYLSVWINGAYRFLTTSDTIWGIKRRLYFPELEASDTTQSTADGTAYISVPTDCLVVREIYDRTNNRRLNWISWSEYIKKSDRADTTAEGDPLKWIRSGTYLYLYPTPDAVYAMTVYYKKRPAALSAADDTTVIGKEWDDVILEVATFMARNWLNEPERAEIAKKTAAEMIGGLMTVYGAEERARRETVRPDEQSNPSNTY